VQACAMLMAGSSLPHQIQAGQTGVALDGVCKRGHAGAKDWIVHQVERLEAALDAGLVARAWNRQVPPQKNSLLTAELLLTCNSVLKVLTCLPATLY
jgi:hypothetical protein